jgi:hypothetical protein
VCAGLYVAVCLVVTGMVPYANLGGDAPLANAFKERGLNFVSVFISVGAVCGLTTTVLVGLYVQVLILHNLLFYLILSFSPSFYYYYCQLLCFFAIKLFGCDDLFVMFVNYEISFIPRRRMYDSSLYGGNVFDKLISAIMCSPGYTWV